MRPPWMPKDPLAAQIVRACNALLPLARAAKNLLKRKPMSPAELVSAVPNLAAWDHFGATPLAVATAIAAGDTPYAIIKALSGTRRTPEQIQALYRDWIARQPRAGRHAAP